MAPHYSIYIPTAISGGSLNSTAKAQLSRIDGSATSFEPLVIRSCISVVPAMICLWLVLLQRCLYHTLMTSFQDHYIH